MSFYQYPSCVIEAGFDRSGFDKSGFEAQRLGRMKLGFIVNRLELEKASIWTGDSSLEM